MKKETKRFLAGSVALLSLVVAGCSQSNRHQNQQRKTTEATSEVTTQVASNTKGCIIVQQHHLIGMTKGCTTDKISNKRMLNQISGKTVTMNLEGVQKSSRGLE